MLRKLLPTVNVKVLHKVYFAHFCSHISYGIVFWGSSSSMRNVFITQKRAIRIMLTLGPRSSRREDSKKLNILTVPCLYTYALMLFAVKNLNTFTAIVDFSRFNNSCLKSPPSTLVDLTFQSRALRSFSLNQLRNLSL